MDDRKLSDNQEIADEFNNYFLNIVNIVRSNNVQNTQFSKYLKDPCTHSVYFYQTTESEIIDLLKNLKSTKSSGFDKISTFLVKKKL